MSRKNYKKGIYKPRNRSKYKGGKLPAYRSSWELRFFEWCDYNPNVLEWTSESTAIPYVSPLDGKIHHYLVDNNVKIREGNKIVNYIIEIKPKKQLKKPKATKNKKKSTLIYELVQFQKNLAKWEAAKSYAVKKGIKFQIITEDQLFSKR